MKLPEDIEMAWRYEMQLFTEGSPIITLPCEPPLETVVDVEAALRVFNSITPGVDKEIISLRLLKAKAIRTERVIFEVSEEDRDYLGGGPPTRRFGKSFLN